MKLRAKLAGTVALALCACLFAGCQPTPETAPVINRGSDSLLKEASVAPLPAGETKTIDAPAHWKETLTRRDGEVVVEADTDINLPEISNTPVIELRKKDFTRELLTALTKYFAGDGGLFQPQRLTKAELSAELDKLNSSEEGYANPAFAGQRENMKSAMAELIGSAPDSTAPAAVSEIDFSAPAQTEAGFLYGGKQDAAQSRNTFRAAVRPGGINAEIYAVRNDETSEAISRFDYTRGHFYTETDLNNDRVTLEGYASRQNTSAASTADVQPWTAARERFMENARRIMDQSPAVTSGQAKELGDRALGDLGVSGLGFGGCEKGVQFSEDNYRQYEMNDMCVDFADAKPGWLLHYYRESGGLLSCVLDKGSMTQEEYAASPPFYPESATIFVTEDGIQRFLWDSMAEPAGVITANTRLLAFDEIKERLADHINFTKGPDVRLRATVTGVSLRLADTPAKDRPENSWLTPVWVFFMTRHLTLPDGGEFEDGVEQCQIDAVTGAYIPAAGGYIIS